MEAVVHIVDVERTETRNGNTRFTVRDADRHEYVTFRPAIGERAERCTGKLVHIEFHEEHRGQYQNVYLDAVAPAADVDEAEGKKGEIEADAVADADIVAWETAAEAGALIVGDARVSGEELFEALKPFKDRVADDIRHGGRLDEREDEAPANVLPLRKKRTKK
jgi:hypothetical protein